MSSNGWTPGPWRALLHEREGLIYGDRMVLGSTGARGYVSDANAALMAAAPELYAALESAIPFLASHPTDAVLSRLKDAEAALKKARGET